MYPEIKGLSSHEAGEILRQNGPNALPEKPPPKSITILFSQFKNPLVYVLVFAGAITLAMGHYPDTIIIAFAITLNTVLGFFQERKASKALQALKKLVTHQAEVIRDGKRQKVDSTNLVAGDYVILSQGTKIPADGALVETNRFFADESILTGESTSVAKEKDEKVFMGTLVASGQGLMLVEATGAGTKIGEIATQVQEEFEDTPLKRQITRFSKHLVILIAFLISLVFTIGIIKGEETIEIFKTAVALAVSSIPEGLIVSLTVVLAIGMQRILKRNGLVRNLSSAETLGGVTTICVDKTGTLTEGKMRVVDVIGEKLEIAKQVIVANDLDDPIVIAAFEWGRGYVKNFIQKHPRIDSIPFTPKERFFASLNKWEKGKNMVFVNGAPDFLIEWSNLTASEKKELKRKMEELTAEGKRIIGFGRKIVPSSQKTLKVADAKAGLEWVGILAFSDPVRKGVREALKEAQKAGIDIIVITGDYPATAEAVLSQIGMPVKKGEIILGDELVRMGVDKLKSKVSTVKLFARTTPDQKFKIVEALKKNGEVVAMMGDGINDAPALNRADVGIVVGEATDVARESADLVLLDSNFATIVAAVEEGRGIFDNIRKIILYLLSDAFGEIVIVLTAIIAGLPLPITAVQILWINLVSDGFPGLALTIDPKMKGSMERPPRSPKEPLVAGWMKVLIGLVSVSSAMVALSFFIYIFSSTGDLILARSVAFLTLGMNSLFYVFSVRTLTTPFWRNNVFENKWLIVAAFAGFGLQMTPFSTPAMREFFGITKLEPNYLLIAFVLPVVMFIMIEVSKTVFRFRNERIH